MLSPQQICIPFMDTFGCGRGAWPLEYLILLSSRILEQNILCIAIEIILLGLS